MRGVIGKPAASAPLPLPGALVVVSQTVPEPPVKVVTIPSLASARQTHRREQHGSGGAKRQTTSVGMVGLAHGPSVSVLHRPNRWRRGSYIQRVLRAPADDTRVDIARGGGRWDLVYHGQNGRKRGCGRIRPGSEHAGGGVRLGHPAGLIQLGALSLGRDVPVRTRCNSVNDTALPVNATCLSGTMPTGTGGTIADGTYVLTSQTFYNAGSVCPGPRPRRSSSREAAPRSPRWRIPTADPRTSRGPSR